MIFDKIQNAQTYYSLGEKIQKGFEFIKNTDLLNLPEGRYEILGDEIFANVQNIQTKAKEDKKWEVHRKYIDIQYVISGYECMGYGILSDFSEVTEKYDGEKDVEFLNGDKFNFVNVQEGEFVIFYPQDVHAPMLSVDKTSAVKKVIVKVAL